MRPCAALAAILGVLAAGSPKERRMALMIRQVGERDTMDAPAGREAQPLEERRSRLLRSRSPRGRTAEEAGPGRWMDFSASTGLASTPRLEPQVDGASDTMVGMGERLEEPQLASALDRLASAGDLQLGEDAVG